MSITVLNVLLSVIMLNDIMLSVIMSSVVMLSVVAPLGRHMEDSKPEIVQSYLIGFYKKVQFM
jgi:hypothetical protein